MIYVVRVLYNSGIVADYTVEAGTDALALQRAGEVVQNNPTDPVEGLTIVDKYEGPAEMVKMDD